MKEGTGGSAGRMVELEQTMSVVIELTAVAHLTCDKGIEIGSPTVAEGRYRRTPKIEGGNRERKLYTQQAQSARHATGRVRPCAKRQPMPNRAHEHATRCTACGVTPLHCARARPKRKLQVTPYWAAPAAPYRTDNGVKHADNTRPRRTLEASRA